MNTFLHSVLSVFTKLSHRPTRSPAQNRRLRPEMESLEGRELPSATPLLAPVAKKHPQARHVRHVHRHVAVSPVIAPVLNAVSAGNLVAAPAAASAPNLVGDTFFIYSKFYPGVHHFHKLKIQSMTQTGGSTNDGGPVFALTGTWDGPAVTGTLGWHPSLNEFVFDGHWTDAGQSYRLNADITPPVGSWTAGDLQFEGRLDNGSFVSLVHGQQTSFVPFPPTGGVNLAGNLFTIYSATYPGAEHFHFLKIQTVTATGESNSAGPLYAVTGTWDGHALTYATLYYHPQYSEFVLDFEWTDAGKGYGMVANITAPTGDWVAGDLQLEGWLNSYAPHQSPVVEEVPGQQTGGPHPWDTVFSSGNLAPVAALP